MSSPLPSQHRAPCAALCATVLYYLLQSRWQNVGIGADSSRLEGGADRGKRQEQAVCGAPGWNRTSDTRFRKHAEGVMASGASWAIVLHSPGFREGAVMGCAVLCWAVRGRLVGGMSAAEPPQAALQATSRSSVSTLTPPCRSPSEIEGPYCLQRHLAREVYRTLSADLRALHGLDGL